MSERPVYLTLEGHTQLQQELEQLKSVRRHEVSRRLHEALKEGELIENAELEDARREQAFVEGRIYNLEQMLRSVTIIEEREQHHDFITVGSRVRVQEANEDTPEDYQVVGSAEADPVQGKISNESPLGKVLLGKKVGDKAIVRAPDGDIVFHILSIS